MVSSYARAILFALQAKHVYQGTAKYAVKQSRRAANRVARKTRRQQRLTR